MNLKRLSKKDINEISRLFADYYNNFEDGNWTLEKATKRISQYITINESMCLGLYENQKLIGFVLGYYKTFDDILGYYLEEIVIDGQYQNKGYGSFVIKELEKIVSSDGASIIELSSVNSEKHMHFYKKSGFYISKNIILMGKFLK
ncbi:MAG: GNAT family N-acetyltransferase [Tissierellia bacterium]|nr:GNAT family N-acetyltransferase [Tissierellia bacterium]